MFHDRYTHPTFTSIYYTAKSLNLSKFSKLVGGDLICMQDYDLYVLGLNLNVTLNSSLSHIYVTQELSEHFEQCEAMHNQRSNRHVMIIPLSPK